MKRQLTKIEDLGDGLEEALILDIKYSTIGLAQQWEQLYQLGMRMQHNVEQQIQARYTEHRGQGWGRACVVLGAGNSTARARVGVQDNRVLQRQYPHHIHSQSSLS